MILTFYFVYGFVFAYIFSFFVLPYEQPDFYDMSVGGGWFSTFIVTFFWPFVLFSIQLMYFVFLFAYICWIFGFIFESIRDFVWDNENIRKYFSQKIRQDI